MSVGAPLPLFFSLPPVEPELSLVEFWCLIPGGEVMGVRDCVYCCYGSQQGRWLTYLFFSTYVSPLSSFFKEFVGVGGWGGGVNFKNPVMFCE